jgi:hypothetical protein
MMPKTKIALAVCGAVLMTAPAAEAQLLPWEDFGYVAFNLGAQAQSRTFTEISTPVIYNENASVTVPHSVGSGILIDVAGGIRVWRNLALGAGFSTFADDESPTVSAEIPNPIAFGNLRPASASAGTLEHRETAIHVQALWMIPVSDKLEVAAVGGPSFYRIRQELVSGLSLTEGAPPAFATVSIDSVETDSVSETAVGFTVGMDGTYLVTPTLGAGAFVRFSAASADLPSAGGSTVSVDAGGFQAGLGLRVRF